MKDLETSYKNAQKAFNALAKQKLVMEETRNKKEADRAAKDAEADTVNKVK